MPGPLLAVILTIPPEPQKVGAPIPISTEVRNISDHPLWMVGVLDGSEMGFRYPHYKPLIRGPKSLPPSDELDACGNVAPLRLQDFRSLPPGEGFDPTASLDGTAYLPLQAFANFRPSIPGRYEFTLTVSTASQKEQDWLGMLGYPGEEMVLARLAYVARLQVESNIAIVEVR